MPSLFPCLESLSGCDCSSYPVRNFSQELPDVPVFLGNYNQPPTTGTWFAPACFGFCESTVSQEDANDCAASVAFLCSMDGAPPGAGGGNFAPANRKFGNTSQDCEKSCPDETCPQTDTVAPNTVRSAWQADADARAKALACQRAEDKLICFLTSSLPKGNVNSPYSSAIVAFGGTHSPTFSVVSGSLPPGLFLNSANGDITGTPTTSATYAFTVRLTTDVATCDKAFSIEIADSCATIPDWCTGHGACRLRVKDFNLLDWAQTWDGNLPNVGTAVPPLVPCDGFEDDTGFVGLNYQPSGAAGWKFSVLNPDLTVYTADGPLGPSTTSPIGTYTKAIGSDPGGPLTFDIEVMP